MTILFYSVIVLVTFVVMEGLTWFSHKFIMHGFLWGLHEDHHSPRYPNKLERNDLFFIMGAIPSIVLFYFGSVPELDFKFFIGLGMFLYGMAYFLVHDVLIHRRFNWFRNTKNRYLKGLRKAHKIHHKNLGKENGECFGMLFVPFRFFKRYGAGE